MASATSRPERFLYRFGGLTLDSDGPVPGLAAGVPSEPTLFLEHRAGPAPEGARCQHQWPGDLGLSLLETGEGWCFASAAGSFHLDRDATRLGCADRPEAHELLVRQVLPRVLHRRGRFVLHGSAVSAPAGAVAILGPSGAGKSTLATALLHHLGWPLLGDDALVLEMAKEGPILHPTSSTARLWPDSATALGSAVIASRGLLRRPDKLECVVRGPVALEARPLLRVLILDLEPGAAPSRQVVHLLKHQVRFNPADPDGPARQLALAARLASQVPVQGLRLPRDLARLPEVARDLERLAAA